MMKRSVALGAIALMSLAIAIYQTDSATRTRALADAQRDLAARAQFLADTLDRLLQLRMTQTFTLAALPSLRGFAASDETARTERAAIAQRELHAIVAADPNVRATSIVAVTGLVILTTDGSMGAHWGERAFVREALAGHLHASVPARDFGEVSQYYSAPILDNAGNVAGALIVRVAAQEMWSVFDAQTNTLVVDEYGVRIADRLNAPQPFVALVPLAPETAASAVAEKRYGAEVTQIRATNLPALAEAIKREKATQLVYRDADGQTIHAALRRLVTNPWTVIVFEREDAIFATTRETLWDEIKLMVVALTVAAGFFYAVTRFIFRAPEKMG
jgi:hypothetical protein